MAETFTRQYETASGLVEVIITYDRTYTPYYLDFDVVEDIELSYGYEDEDQLTFYPNVVRVVFDDFKKQNYDVLKLSVGAYANTLPENKMSFGGLEIKLNGNRKFKGYIDELSLEYDEEKLQTSFEAIDLTLQLKDINVNRDWLTDASGNRLEDGSGWTLHAWWYGIFKKIYPDFTDFAYDSSLINIPYLYGTFIKHDWVFHGDGVVIHNGHQINLQQFRFWSNLQDFGSTYFIMDSTPLFGQDSPATTWAEYLKLVAINFGAIIGVMDYGKVYFIKRFGTHNENPIDVSNSILNDNFSKALRLEVLRGTVTTNYGGNHQQSFEFGEVERNHQGQVLYKNRVKEIKTYLPQYRFQSSQYTGISVKTIYEGIVYYISTWEIVDERIQLTGLAAEIVGKWQRDNRIVPKDKIECTLEGIDYDMVTTYRITPPYTNNLAVNFRPMSMKKNLLKNITEIVGIEV